jgi:hypothetical protein
VKSLREVQSGLLLALSEGDDEVLPLIDAAGLGAARRVQIYRNNMLASLTGALRAVYPVVDRLVGEEFFDFTAREYVGRHPSRSGNLHAFGNAFPEFLRGFAPAAALPYLGDVAALEWAYHEVFHAADAPALDLDRLAAVDPADYGKLRFAAGPASRALESVYPILQIWRVNQAGFSGDQRVDLDRGGEYVLVARPALDVELHALSQGEYALFTQLRDGANFEQACEAALKTGSELDLAEALPRFAALRALIGVDLVA